jgi:hypothetical protein
MYFYSVFSLGLKSCDETVTPTPGIDVHLYNKLFNMRSKKKKRERQEDNRRMQKKKKKVKEVAKNRRCFKKEYIYIEQVIIPTEKGTLLFFFYINL